MGATFNISKEILSWIFANIQKENLSKQIIEYLTSWESGDKQPTFAQIQKVSKATKIPLGFFFLTTPPEEDISFVEYRTVKSTEIEKPSRDLIDVMHDMRQIQDWLHNHLISKGESPFNYVGMLDKNDCNINLAQKLRELLRLDIDWFKDSASSNSSFKILRNAISSIGTIVMQSGIVGNNTRRPLSVKEFRAFTLIDNYAPLIFINASDSINGKVFSLLHEFAHICIGENSLSNDLLNDNKRVSETERICNAIASEILVPNEIFQKKWQLLLSNEVQDDELIFKLSKYFKCSKIVIARRAYENNYITTDLYDKIALSVMQEYDDKKTTKGGGNHYNTLKSRIDSRFLNILKSSIAEGKTLYTDAFRLTNTNDYSFHKLINMN